MGKWYDYDFGQSRKEKYVGPGTGSITITPDRKGYSKTGSGKRMKISERNTPRRPQVIVEGPTYGGFVHPANEISGYKGGSTEYERKGVEYHPPIKRSEWYTTEGRPRSKK